MRNKETIETNEVLLSLQNMLLHLESGCSEGYEREKMNYEELKEKRKTQEVHPF